MSHLAELLLPRPALAGCLFAALARDTRGVELEDAQRCNYFPASPLVTLTCIIEGESRLALQSVERSRARQAPAIARISLTGPQTNPFTSWNPGPVFAITACFYPDAWGKLTGMSPSELTDRTLDALPETLFASVQSLQADSAIDYWAAFQEAVLPLWERRRSGDAQWTDTYGRHVADWSRAMIVRASMSGPGRTIRATQRRLLRWTGQSRRSLEAFDRIESVHRLAVTGGSANPAALALEAGFSDQSHMGRAVRKATGFSPVQLNRLIETEEAFWCYRLLGQRF